MTASSKRLVLVALLLSAALFCWPDLFLFSKVVYLPAWAKLLPDPMFASWGIATICLLPAALSSKGARGTIQDMARAVAVGPLLGVVVSSIFRSWSMGNLIFQYLWVLALGLVPPALALVALKAVSAHVAATRGG